MNCGRGMVFAHTLSANVISYFPLGSKHILKNLLGLNMLGGGVGRDCPSTLSDSAKCN